MILLSTFVQPLKPFYLFLFGFQNVKNKYLNQALFRKFVKIRNDKGENPSGKNSVCLKDVTLHYKNFKEHAS